MVKKIITRLLHRRHYWRYMEFTELGNLYASRFLRVTALTMISVFVAIYLYQMGQSLTFIAFYFALQFLARASFAPLSSHIIGRYGPKHSTLFANVLYVPALLALSQMERYGIIVLVLFLVFQSLSASLYNISHNIDFSIIKHRLHAGKEIGYMVVLERAAMAISPLLGGGIAYLFGPQATMWAVMVLFTVSAMPLLRTPEPIRLHQRVSFFALRKKKIIRSYIAGSFIGWDFVASGVIWSLFISIAVFGFGSDAVYVQVGAVASISIITSFVIARMYGILIDTHRGGELLKAGVFATSLLHFVRPFVNTATGVVFANLGTEATKSAYHMPYTKGMYDVADDHTPHRVVFFGWYDFFVAFGAALALISLGVLSLFASELASLQLFYLFTGLIVLGILSHGLRALRITV